MLSELLTRRIFLHRGVTLVGAAATVPAFLEQSALAASPEDGARTRSRPGIPDDHVLVVVQLAGGNDGLNTLVPLGNDLYYKARPQIGIRKDKALALHGDFGLHPSLGGLKSLHDQGLLAVVQGVGYPNPNRSHFKSSDIWETASPDGRQYTGWIGRYFDNCCKGEPDPEAGIALTGQAPLAMRGRKFSPVTFQRPDSLNWSGQKKGRSAPTAGAEAFAKLNEPDKRRSSQAAELAYLQRTAMDARLSSRDIQKAAAGPAGATYPGSPLANSLRTIARMIAADMPTKIYYASQGGYDTHSAQGNRHPQLLSQLGDALKAFVADLAASRQLDRVAIMTFSEFGRRVEENASGGTDHGAAAPMFLIGKRIQPGLHGEAPSLEKLDHGDLAFTTDFRAVYAAVLRDWLGTNPAPILGPEFTPMPLFKAT